MKIKTKILSIVCFALVSIYCKAEQSNEEQNILNNYEPYISVYYHEEDNSLSLIHISSIQKIDQSKVNFWVVRINKNKALDFDTFKLLYQTDCKLNKITNLQMISSIRNKILLNYVPDKKEWIYIPPNAIFENFTKIACSLAFGQSPSKEITERIILLPKDQIKLVKVIQQTIQKIHQ